MNMNMNTNQILKNLREDKDLKQADIAKILCITQQTYSNYENAKSEIPIHHIIKLSEFYNVSTDFILGKSSFKANLSSLNDTLIEGITYGDFLNKIARLNKYKLYSLIDFLNYLLSKK